MAKTAMFGSLDTNRLDGEPPTRMNDYNVTEKDVTSFDDLLPGTHISTLVSHDDLHGQEDREHAMFLGSVDRKVAQAECPGTNVAPFLLSSGVQSEEELRDAKWVVWMVPNGNGTARFRIATVEQFAGGRPLRQHAWAMYGAAFAFRTACEGWYKTTFYDPKNANGKDWAMRCCLEANRTRSSAKVSANQEEKERLKQEIEKQEAKKVEERSKAQDKEEELRRKRANLEEENRRKTAQKERLVRAMEEREAKEAKKRRMAQEEEERRRKEVQEEEQRERQKEERLKREMEEREAKEVEKRRMAQEEEERRRKKAEEEEQRKTAEKARLVREREEREAKEAEKRWKEKAMAEERQRNKVEGEEQRKRQEEERLKRTREGREEKEALERRGKEAARQNAIASKQEEAASLDDACSKQDQPTPVDDNQAALALFLLSGSCLVGAYLLARSGA